MTNDQAITIMRYFHWNEEKFLSKWLDNESILRKEIGLEFDRNNYSRLTPTEKQSLDVSLSSQNQGYCSVCYGAFSDVQSDPQCECISLSCGHQFCLGCWQEYLKALVEEGPERCLKAGCQQMGCNVIVPHSLF
jgi:ariadne-1